MPRRVEDFRGLTQASRVKLLHAVQRVPGRRLPDLAEEAGIHVNTAREHLLVLEEEGLIVSRPVSTGVRGRPPMVFDPVRQPRANIRADRRAAAARMHGDLLRRVDPGFGPSSGLEGEARHQVDALYAHLEDAGLEPELESNVGGANTGGGGGDGAGGSSTGSSGADDSIAIELHPCAYRAMIDEHGTIVCSVHARLVQDQLAQVPGPLKLRKLEPFVTPHSCRLTLGSRDQAAPGDEAPTPDATAPLRADPAVLRALRQAGTHEGVTGS